MTLGYLDRISERHARVRGTGSTEVEKRFSFDDFAQLMSFNGFAYPMVSSASSYSSTEEAENTFQSYVRGAYKSNGIVFSCMLARALVFTEARFLWQVFRNGRPGELSWSPELRPMEYPWPTGQTGELLARQLQDVDLAGNAYVAREGMRVRRLRPDWVSIVLTAPPAEAVESDIAGYLYRPGGLGSSTDGRLYLPHEISHWVPPGLNDPEAQYRGLSWLTSIIQEIQADKAATEHKLNFFRNGATPQMVVTLDASVTPEMFTRFKAQMDETHTGYANAYKTLYLGGGASVNVVGKDLQQIDFKSTQGAGEVRIANAARIPPVLAGLSESLTGSSLNEGNFKAAKRAFADMFLRPMWRSVAAANQNILRVPPQSRLWYDDRDIAFLREDARDRADIAGIESRTIRTLLDAGYTAESVQAAVLAEDWSLLEHTGLFSVQLQPPGSATPALESPVEPEEGDDA